MRRTIPLVGGLSTASRAIQPPRIVTLPTTVLVGAAFQKSLPKPQVHTPRKPRYLQEGYKPLDTYHPAFSIREVHATPRVPKRPPLSTVHAAFGTPPPAPPKPSAQTEQTKLEAMTGRISVSGLFLAVDPNVSIVRDKQMNPNAQLTMKDGSGNQCRLRYRCVLNSARGVKMECLVRTQVGWISPPVPFSEVPEVIHLGKGWDVSIPFVMHFTMVNILNEHGYPTGSCLYFSGTPWLGLSLGYSVISDGKLVMSAAKNVDVEEENLYFFQVHKNHTIHIRQLGFLVFKCVAWLLCACLCLPMLNLQAMVLAELHRIPLASAVLSMLRIPPCLPPLSDEADASATPSDEQSTGPAAPLS